MNLNAQFMDEISRIKQPEVFLGVAKVLGVRLVEEKKKENSEEKPSPVQNGVQGARITNSFDVRDFTEIFADVMEAYSTHDRKFKRELLKILRKSNKTKEVS